MKLEVATRDSTLNIPFALTLLCKAKRQCLFTCKVSRYCFLALHDRTAESVCRFWVLVSVSQAMTRMTPRANPSLTTPRVTENQLHCVCTERHPSYNHWLQLVHASLTGYKRANVAAASLPNITTGPSGLIFTLLRSRNTPLQVGWGYRQQVGVRIYFFPSGLFIDLFNLRIL